MDFAEIERLRARHPAWSLLASDNVALVLSFLSRVFVDANASNLPAGQLESALDDELFALNQRLGVRPLQQDRTAGSAESASRATTRRGQRVYLQSAGA